VPLQLPLNRADQPVTGESLREAIAAVRTGELVVFPTETFYGIAADPMRSDAIERIFAAKGREPGKAIALIAANVDCAFSVALEIPENARRLAHQFWPGPLTLVLPARAALHPAMVGPDGGVGVRVSPHPIAQELARGSSGLITATSANLSGAPAAVTVEEARRSLGAHVKVYLDGGLLTGGLPSTVVVIKRDGSFEVLRPGAIESTAIAAALARPSPAK
jgi:L-threonylcarbamoyladenylate synthase